MKKIINFRVFKGERYYVAECSDLPIITQGITLDETVSNIKEALSLHLEGEDLSDYFIDKSPAVSVTLDLGEYEFLTQ